MRRHTLLPSWFEEELTANADPAAQDVEPVAADGTAAKRGEKQDDSAEDHDVVDAEAEHDDAAPDELASVDPSNDEEDRALVPESAHAVGTTAEGDEPDGLAAPLAKPPAQESAPRATTTQDKEDCSTIKTWAGCTRRSHCMWRHEPNQEFCELDTDLDRAPD